MINRKFELFGELIKQSDHVKQRLTISVNGRQAVGAVTKITGVEAVELKSQLLSRVMAPVDSIPARAIA